ncbi:MAG TPA: M48 family metalloprotease [Fimbriimonas sp.]
MNTLKTGILLAAIGGLAVAIGGYFFGQNGAVIALVLALAFQALSLFQGHKMAIAFARAQELPQGTIPWLEQATDELSRRAGIPSPKLYLSPDPQPNAFAAGWKPDVAVVCFNQGLLDSMSRREVTAVLAHELAHIRNRDTLTMTVAAAAASMISFVAQIGWFIPRGDDSDRNPIVDLLMFLVAPIAAMLIQMAVSRTREYAADQTAAELMGDARPMMEALQTLGMATSRIPSRTAQPATAHMYISQPLHGGLMSLFSTHPPLESRIQRLASLTPSLAAA